MQIFRKTKFLFLGLLFGFLVHSNNVSSDISKAFPDMSNVFERVDFYNKDNKFEDSLVLFVLLFVSKLSINLMN